MDEETGNSTKQARGGEIGGKEREEKVGENKKTGEEE